MMTLLSALYFSPRLMQAWPNLMREKAFRMTRSSVGSGCDSKEDSPRVAVTLLYGILCRLYFPIVRRLLFGPMGGCSFSWRALSEPFDKTQGRPGELARPLPCIRPIQ
jgi:hypothetical protein